MDGTLFSTLTSTLEDDNIWVIDSGASRHMIGEYGQLQTISKGISSHSVELGDKKSYSVKGIGSTLLELETRGRIHLNNILFVPSLKTNWLSISCLKDRGDMFAFVDDKAIVWGKGSSIEYAKTIGIHKGRLYRLLTHLH